MRLFKRVKMTPVIAPTTNRWTKHRRKSMYRRRCAYALSEWYESEQTTRYHSDGGAFSLVSFEGSASGGGSYSAPSSSYSCLQTYNEWSSFSSYGNYVAGGCGYDNSTSCGNGCYNVTYDYTADWYWHKDGTISANVDNHVTGYAETSSLYSKSYGWDSYYSYCYPCTDCYHCSYSTPSGSVTLNYDDAPLSHVGWRHYGDVPTLINVRFSAFGGYTYECAYSYDDGCGYSYDYYGFYASFGAPGFGASIYDEQYDYGNGCVYGCSYIDASSSPPGWWQWNNNSGGNCFTAGTQIVVGVEFDEHDVFVQYVTKNIEDIKVGDLVYSYDTITGTPELKEVTAVFVREVTHINYLTVEDEFGNVQVLEVTDVSGGRQKLDRAISYERGL